ncbi:MAG: hypothetical protein RRB13_09970 [bacterium]|nr:hypothetical protein [bacterium]
MKSIKYLIILSLLVGCGKQLTQDNQGAADKELPERTTLTFSGLSGTPAEGGATASMTVQAGYAPTSSFTLTLTDAQNQISFSPEKLVFTADNWSVAREVTITAIDDSDNDDNAVGTVGFRVLTDDLVYQKATANSYSVSTLDNDSRLDELGAYEFTLLRSGGTCPAGFTAGSISLDTEDLSNNDSVTGEVGDTWTGSNGLHLELCTLDQPISSAWSNATATGFAFLRHGGSCPSGMAEGTIRINSEIDNTDSSISGNAGDSYIKAPYVYLETCESTASFDYTLLETASFTLFKSGSCPGSSSGAIIKVDTEDDTNYDAWSGAVGDSYVSQDQGTSVFLQVCTY